MKKRMILALLTIALVAVSIFAVEAFATDPVQVPEQMDLCLTEELAQAQAVLERFPLDGTDRVYENPQEIGASFIPEGACCMEICAFGEVVSIDYRLDGVRYIVEYRKDGVVGITATLWPDPVEEVYSVYSDTGEVEVLRVADITEVWVASEEEIAQQLQGTLEAEATDEMVDAVEYFAVDELKEVNIDFDLSDEMSHVDEVLRVFQPNDPDGFREYPNPQEVAAPYIPEGAWCTDVCIMGYVVFIDYRIGNVRYIASYCNDGTVTVTSSILADEIEYVYEITSDNPEMVKRRDCAKNTIVWQKESEAQKVENP